MAGHKISIRGFRIKKAGRANTDFGEINLVKLERTPGFGMNASQKIKQKTSKRVRPVKRGKT